MNIYLIPVSLIAALVFTFIFSGFFRGRGRGPLGGLFLFFVILFLTTWSGQLWINPISPLYFGVDWVLLIFTAIVFSLFMIALSAPLETPPKTSDPATPEKEAGVAIGVFFWVVLILLAIAVVGGHLRKTSQPPAVESNELMAR
jgi:hypothetical protein